LRRQAAAQPENRELRDEEKTLDVNGLKSPLNFGIAAEPATGDSANRNSKVAEQPIAADDHQNSIKADTSGSSSFGRAMRLSTPNREVEPSVDPEKLAADAPAVQPS